MPDPETAQTAGEGPAKTGTTRSVFDPMGNVTGGSNHPGLPLRPALTLGVLVVAGVAICGYRFRTAAVRAWRNFSQQIGGEFEAASAYDPRFVSGKVGERAIFVETATSHEDDAPYFHTRVSTPVFNPGQHVLGVRRKSMLEEAQSRKEQAMVLTGDSDFDGKFAMEAGDPEILRAVLTPEVRRGLLKYGDVELYLAGEVIEWRRAGLVRDTAALKHLTDVLILAANAVDAMPLRPITLTQKLAEQELLRKGV